MSSLQLGTQNNPSSFSYFVAAWWRDNVALAACGGSACALQPPTTRQKLIDLHHESEAHLSDEKIEGKEKNSKPLTEDRDTTTSFALNTRLLRELLVALGHDIAEHKIIAGGIDRRQQPLHFS